MQTSQDIAKLIPLKSKEMPTFQYVPHLARLANFLRRHQLASTTDRDSKEPIIIEVRRSDAEIAFHLGISMTALERCFSELIRQRVIRLRGAYQIEILSDVRLSELAKQQG